MLSLFIESNASGLSVPDDVLCVDGTCSYSQNRRGISSNEIGLHRF